MWVFYPESHAVGPLFIHAQGFAFDPLSIEGNVRRLYFFGRRSRCIALFLRVSI